MLTARSTEGDPIPLIRHVAPVLDDWDDQGTATCEDGSQYEMYTMADRGMVCIISGQSNKAMVFDWDLFVNLAIAAGIDAPDEEVPDGE